MNAGEDPNELLRPMERVQKEAVKLGTTAIGSTVSSVINVRCLQHHCNTTAISLPQLSHSSKFAAQPLIQLITFIHPRLRREHPSAACLPFLDIHARGWVEAVVFFFSSLFDGRALRGLICRC